ncbi:MAG: amino acid permease [Myxococcota bacterium]|nr:amino acid permease [Myxococcota bacterium]
MTVILDIDILIFIPPSAKAKPMKSTETRTLSLSHSFCMVVGSMLGVGIFLYPPTVAKLCSPTLYFLTWIFGGFIALAGAASCAELSTMMPKAGGDYHFQRTALNPSIAFATGWVLFLGIFSGSIATMSVALFQYQIPTLLGKDFSTLIWSYPWGGGLSYTNFGACVTVLVLSAICKIGIRSSGWLQLIFTAIPLVSLFFFSLYALGTFEGLPPSTSPAQNTLLGWMEAYLVVYFAYSGWNSIIYIAGDIQHPHKNIPRALIGGTLSTTVLYVLLCGTFVYVLGFDTLAQTIEAGTAIAGILGGSLLETTMTVLIALAILASINGTLLAGARTGHSMGKDGLFFNQKLSQDAIISIQCIWSIILILTGRFETLTQLTSLAMLLTGSITVSIIFVLRYRKPDDHRPYRCTGYPLIPLTYLVCNLSILGFFLFQALGKTSTLFTQEETDFWSHWKDWYPLFGLCLFILAFGIHTVWRRSLKVK